MSEVKTDKISPRTASGTLTVGDSGDTLTVPSGVTFNAAVTGSGAAITALNATNLATGTVPTARLGSGTADATTFLRGDNAWATAGGDNTPAFYVWRISSHQSITNDTLTKIAFNGEIYDPDNVFDSTTNYRFTVPAGEGGNYFFFWDISLEALSNTTLHAFSLYLRVNGTNKLYSHTNYAGSYIRRTGIPGSVMLALSAADYVELWISINTTNSAAGDVNYSNGYVHTGFGGFKLL